MLAEMEEDFYATGIDMFGEVIFFLFQINTVIFTKSKREVSKKAVKS